MKRKAAWSGFSFLGGTMLMMLQVWSIGVMFVCASVLTAAAAILFRRQRVYALVVGLCLLAGLAHGWGYTHFRIRPQLDLDGREVTINGTVTDCTYIGSDSWRMAVKGSTEDGTRAGIVLYSGRPVEERNEVELTCTAEALTDSALFRATDYYSSRGLYLTASGDVRLTDKGRSGGHFMRLAARLRDCTSDCIFAACDDESAGLLQAIVCGDKSELSPADRTALNRAGVGHLMAVSGTHIAVVALLFSTIFSTVYFPKRLRTLLMSALILLFMGFAGFSPSVTRAGIMLILVQLSILFGRRTDALNSLGLCGLIMAVFSPYAVTGAAFLLSMASAAAIGAAAPRLAPATTDGPQSSLKQSLTASFCVLAVTLPLQAVFFNEVSILSPLTNLLLVPLCSAALGLLPFAMLLGGTTAPAQLLLRLSGLLVKLILRCGRALAGLSFSSVSGCHRVLLALAATALAAVLSAAIMKRSARLLASGCAVLLSAVLLLSQVAVFLRRDKIRIVAVNNSSSTTAVIIRGSSAVILDIGSRGRHAYTVQSLMSFYGVREVECVFISGDSSGGIYTESILPAAERLCTELGSAGERFSAGDTATVGDLEIKRAASGFEISAFGTTFTLSPRSLTLPSGNVEYPKGGAILELELSPDSAQLWQLNSAFYRQSIE